jgi:zinc protease
MMGRTFQSDGRPLAIPPVQLGEAGPPVQGGNAAAFTMGWAEIQQAKPKIREKKRGFPKLGLEIVELCPKSANFLQKQGISREFFGFLPKVLSTKPLVSGRFKKLAGNYRAILLPLEGVLHGLFSPGQSRGPALKRIIWRGSLSQGLKALLPRLKVGGSHLAPSSRLAYSSHPPGGAHRAEFPAQLKPVPLPKSFTKCFCIASTMMFCAGIASAQQTWQQVPIPPLAKFNPQEPTRVQLPNGMVIFLQEDHELPLISATALIKGGASSEPASKVGLVSIYAAAWRTGGTEEKSGDQLDDELESIAARVETGGAMDTTSVSFNCLKQNLDQVFAEFIDVLEHPAFREDKIDLAKRRLKTSIARRNDEIGSIAGREAAKLGYGPDSPYGRDMEYWTVDAVTRQDLVDWHKRHLAANNIIFGVVGDFDSKQMEARLRQALGSLPKGTPYDPPKIPVPGPKAGVYLAEKNDVNQSDISMLGLGIRRDNPDYFAVRVMNEIFGGGFSSRLFKNLRATQALAYSVGGGIGAGYNHPGLIDISMGTKSASTAKAIDGLYKQIDDLLSNPPSETELKQAKDSILNGFIFAYDSPDKILSEQLTYELYGYPKDFLERFRDAVEKVTGADVNRVARKYIDKRKLAVLVVGNPKEFDKPLTTFGQVTKLDITIPMAPTGAKATVAGK